jgi:UDP-N-acetylmuramoylalanine--D-glutamate ligase
VLELSSYQLELAQTVHVNTAIFLNITADHLERHGTMEAYIAAKKRIFMQQTKDDAAIIGVDSAAMRKVYDDVQANGRARVIPISVTQKLKDGVYVADGQLVDALGRKPLTVVDLSRFDKLVGIHNWQNCLAAYAAARMQGLEPDAIVEAMASFAGLAHRQEVIAVHRGIRYINDSKATNADAAARALSCYESIYWILGGQPKTGGIDMLQPYFPRIVHAYCIGQAAEAFAATLKKSKVPHTILTTLDEAVKAAHAKAQRDGRSNGVVLLSPACASFDQFANFEQRGDVFRTLVTTLLAEENNRHAGNDALAGVM